MHALTQQRYTGCLATPPLWTGNDVSPFPQMELPNIPEFIGEDAASKKHRLGKWVEAFIFHALKADSSVSWITDNLQIQQDKRTVGEVDALLYHHGQPVHLEVAYKFYLYDMREQYKSPLGPWIGPNRKDRLTLKLDKLHRKQFPLLRSELAGRYLQEYGLTFGQLQQMLCFKGQLFLPYQQAEMDVAPLNSDCITGLYLTLDELEAFEDCTFYIPQKLDWLIRPHHQVPWLAYVEAREAIKGILDRRRSPLVWVKREEVVGKHFVVFW